MRNSIDLSQSESVGGVSPCTIMATGDESASTNAKESVGFNVFSRIGVLRFCMKVVSRESLRFIFVESNLLRKRFKGF